MNRQTASMITFACTIAAAALAVAIMSSAAIAETVELPPGVEDAVLAATQLGGLAAGELKHDYVVCERAATQTTLDTLEMALPALCAALYEELRTRVFQGSSDALLAWFREAWHGGAAAAERTRP
ncbi:MAG: hypothetical protein NDJ19_01030 [Ramlibacter sp.]|nr:hypothetical protein [Ramlibacter sp.]